MKGTDCTPEQLQAASDFLAVPGWPEGTERAELERSDIVHLLAWYGALRFQAGRDGTGGTLEVPGAFDVKPREVRP